MLNSLDRMIGSSDNGSSESYRIQRQASFAHRTIQTFAERIPLIASIESPSALMRLGEIASWEGGQNFDLVGLLVSRRALWHILADG